MPSVVVSGISFRFPRLSRCEGQIAHVLLTRSPLVYPRRGLTARLACVKHAASVRPEPGSNSPLKSVDVRAPEGGTAIKSLEYPGKSCFSVRKDREDFVLPKEPSDDRPDRRTGLCHVDGALINSSSTFGTLLSSQGSCAHRCQALRPGFGATRTNLPGAWRGRQIGFLVPDPAQIDASAAHSKCDSGTGHDRGGSRWAGRPVFRVLSKALRPVASGEAGRTLRSGSDASQIGSVCRRSHRRNPRSDGRFDVLGALRRLIAGARSHNDVIHTRVDSAPAHQVGRELGPGHAARQPHRLDELVGEGRRAGRATPSAAADGERPQRGPARRRRRVAPSA